MKAGKLFFGLLAGLSAGLLIGILIAPDKGSETRKKYFKKGEGYAEELKKKFNELIDEIAAKAASGKTENHGSSGKEDR